MPEKNTSPDEPVRVLIRIMLPEVQPDVAIQLRRQLNQILLGQPGAELEVNLLPVLPLR